MNMSLMEHYQLFSSDEKSYNVQKLIFMKIQDDSQGGGHIYKPHGTQFDVGTLTILQL